MIIYVQSRGKNQDQDYRWLKIKENEHYLKTPKFLLQPLENSPVKPVNLIESQKFSIILVKLNKYFCLLITGLKAKEDRNDFQGRRVRNSLFWICDTTEIQNAEMKVRSVLIRALQGDLEQEIDSAIDIGGKYGFKAEQSNLEQILLNSSLLLENNPSQKLNCKISSNSKLSREQLASELQTRSFPERDGVLVLVTSIKSLSALQKINVWRGLSDRIKDEEYSLETVDRQAQKKTKKHSLVIILIVIVTISLIGIAIQTTNQQKPQPQIDPGSPNLEKSILEKELNLSKEASSFIQKPLTCQEAVTENYFLSPCFSNKSKS